MITCGYTLLQILKKVVIFYHKADVDDFIAVADAIEVT